MLQIIILAMAVLANVSLGLLVFLKNPKSSTGRRFLFLTIAIALWAIVNYISIHPPAGSQLLTIRLVLFSASILNLAVFLTFRVFPFAKAPKDKLVLPSILFTVFVAGLTLTPMVFSHLQVSSTGSATPVPAPGIALFLLQTLALLGGAIVTLVLRYRVSRQRVRQQFKYVIYGLTVSFSLIILTNFILVAFFHITSLLPFGAAYTLFFSISVTYSVVRQRLFDIRLVLAKVVAYLLLLVTFAGVYTAVAFTIVSVLFPETRASVSTSALSAGLAIIFALTFQPLRRFFEKITSRVFYRERYDSQEVLNELSKILVSELDLNRMMKRALTALCEQLHIQFGQIVVFNNGRVYRIEHYGPLPKRLMIAPELAQLSRSMLIADELHSGESKSIMDGHGIRVSMQLHTRGELVGYLLLGDKLSGDIYSSQDIELLEIIGKELAVAIQNAKAYAEIEEFNVTLQARVDHATGRLRVANRHLKELDRAKDEFISMASHQLRTPLTTIKGYLSMMLEGDAGKLSSAQKEFVGYAFGSSERMVNLISDLLNVSRLSAGRFLIQTKPTDMVQMIADEVRQLDTHATAKGIKLIFDHPTQTLPPAQIDDNKTRQVIMNFIDNAIYYTQSGEVRVTLHQTADVARLEVTDTGIGVPEGAKKKLFSKFYRADNAQIVRPDGTGLGLYLAKRVVEDQGGTIIFNSTEGKGSTFGFELPTHPLPAPHKDNHGHSR